MEMWEIREKKVGCGHILKDLKFKIDLTGRRVPLKMVRPRVRIRVVILTKE